MKFQALTIFMGKLNQDAFYCLSNEFDSWEHHFFDKRNSYEQNGAKKFSEWGGCRFTPLAHELK